MVILRTAKKTVTVGKPKQQLNKYYPRNSETGCLIDDYYRNT